MKYLYVDNFRGFQETFIPIKDVNFFVGENSTGKSSILGLLRLISSPKFWLSQEFNTDEINFSHFKDIVSINTSNRNYFDVGLIDFCNNNENDYTMKAFLMTFTEFEGMPYLKKITYQVKDNEFKIIFSQNSIKYKYAVPDKAVCDEEFIKFTYNKWIESHRKDNKGYKRFPEIFRKSIKNAPLFIILSVLNEVISEKKKKSQDGITVRSLPSPPIFNDEIAWLAPVRSKPKRTYDSYMSDYSPEGDHTPYLIKRILDKEVSAKELKKFFKEIGKESGLFEGVAVKQYGRGATSPFELDVIINNKPLSICSVGYGVSQSLPVIVELFSRSVNSWFAIQQPEVHLHPKAQAALGAMFFNLASSERKKFFIETHSDYTIDRFRISCKKSKEKNKPESQILYFEKTNDGNKIYQLEIGHEGDLPCEQPAGYRDFFVKEELELLNI